MDAKSEHNVCALCSLNMENYGVGKCNHTVCGKCAIRMRVICLSKECPVCRQHLERVFITHKAEAFENLDPSKLILNSEYDMLFETRDLEVFHKELMKCKCKICKNMECSSMSALNRHYNNVHQLHFCDLCMNNLKHFPVEFPVYNGAELVAHRDWNPTAPGRGHPLCKFCNRRYFDADEWYRHLRREHFMCHICEREAADTRSKRTVFGDYQHLLDHCRTAHFVCEEGECAQQTFTNVFASETELKAHRLQTHPLSKAAAKEARRLDLEIRFTGDTGEPRGRGRGRGQGGGGGGGGGGGVTVGGGEATSHRKPPGQHESGLGLDMRNLPGMQQALEISQTVDAQLAARANGELPYTENPSDFPTLGGHAPDFRRPGQRAGPPVASQPPPQRSLAEREEEDDLWLKPKPRLEPEPEPARQQRSPEPAAAAPGAALYAQRQAGRGGFSAADFPALSTEGKAPSGAGGVWNRAGAGKPGPGKPGVGKPGTRMGGRSGEDFPSLGGGGGSSGGSGGALPWKPSAHTARPAAPVAKKAPSFSGDDFPTLGGGSGSGSGGNSLPWHSSVKKPAAKTPPKKAPPPAKKSAPPPQRAHVRKQEDEEDEKARWTASYAEEKTGMRLSAAAAYESATPQGVGAKIQVIHQSDLSASSGPAFSSDPSDFPAMRRAAPPPAEVPQWGHNAPQSRDIFYEPPEAPEAPRPAAPAPLAPNVESAADFPSLLPAKATNEARPEGRKGKKGKKGRRAAPREAAPTEAETEAAAVESESAPAVAPFSMGDLTAALLDSEYKSVPDMEERNDVLLETLTDLLGHRFDRFAQASMRYRNRELSARSYLAAISEFVSERELDSFMPEMLVLLPDVGLQRSLLTLLKPALRCNIRECASCGQVVTVGDLQAHLAAH